MFHQLNYIKMKSFLKILASIVVLLLVVGGISMATGYGNVFYTKTVGKAQQNADREVFERTQSYVEGKRQEATKYRLEYMRAEDAQEKRAIQMTIAQSFANFDEHLLPIELSDFISDMKYAK